MKGFKTFLLEMSMTVAEARKLLGIDFDTRLTPEVLKKAYRSASMRAHPDRGGTNAEMQKVNAAFEMLQNTTGGDTGLSAKEAMEERARNMALRLLNAVDGDAYHNYLDSVFGDIASLETFENRVNEASSWASRRMEFASQDRETVIKVSFSFQYHQFYRTDKKLGAGADEDMIPGDMFIMTEILHDRQKVKLSRQDFDITKSPGVFTDPSVVFPEDKLRKKIREVTKDSASSGGSGGAKKMKKRDFITSLKNKFPDGQMATGSEIAYIHEFGGGITFQATRITMMRQGFWVPNIFPRRFRSRESMPHLPETDKTLEFFFQIVEDMKRTEDYERVWQDAVSYAKKNMESFWPAEDK